MTVIQAHSADEFLRPRRWTHDEYYALYDADFFDEQRVELLDGEIWRLPPQSPRHVYCILQAIDLLKTAFGAGFNVRQQGPFVVSEYTEPEPDILVVSGSWRDYANHHPAPAEAHLLVEVSDAWTLAKDKSRKLEIYAEAAIAEYWIVNLVNRQLEVYRDPAPLNDSYAYKITMALVDGSSVAPLSAPNSTIAVADLFPPAERPE